MNIYGESWRKMLLASRDNSESFGCTSEMTQKIYPRPLRCNKSKIEVTGLLEACYILSLQDVPVDLFFRKFLCWYSRPYIIFIEVP